MKKSNYRNGNETIINYYNKITAKLDSYGLESLNIIRTETLLFIDKDIEHFTIDVTVPNKLSDMDVEKFYEIIEQQILPEYMKDFYNTVDFKVRLLDESGKSPKIERIFKNKQMQEDKFYKYDGTDIFPKKIKSYDGYIFTKVNDGIYENAFLPVYMNERGDSCVITDIEKYEVVENSSENTKIQMQDYKYIIKCDLDNHNHIYQNQYLLVEDYKIQSNLDVDLIGDCCFNCDFEILDPKLVAKVQSFDDVKKFCESNKIDITKNLDKEGNLIVGASKDMIIASDLNRYDREQEIKKEL